jgi:hypothetical protein
MEAGDGLMGEIGEPRRHRVYEPLPEHAPVKEPAPEPVPAQPEPVPA